MRVFIMDQRQPGHWERFWRLDTTHNTRAYSIADTVIPAEMRIQRQRQLHGDHVNFRTQQRARGETKSRPETAQGSPNTIP